MTGLILRIAVIVALGLAIAWGLRRIWRDWTGHFRAQDKAAHERDLKERQRPDVIELKRDADGTYRPTRKDEKAGRD